MGRARTSRASPGPCCRCPPSHSANRGSRLRGNDPVGGAGEVLSRQTLISPSSWPGADPATQRDAHSAWVPGSGPGMTIEGAV
jgi:hypothetical protein